MKSRLLLPLKRRFDHQIKSFAGFRKKAYFDIGSRESDILLVAGTARSGTTWVGNVIAQATRSRLIFEPFLTDRNRDFALSRERTNTGLGEKQLCKNYPLYIPCHEGARSKYYSQIFQILNGRVKSKWSEQLARPGFFRRRVIKEIRANLFLGYIAQNWPNVKIQVIIRNPFGVINSMIAKNQKGWKFDWDKDDILSQPSLLNDCLSPFSESIGQANSLVDRLTYKWCVETYVPLNQLKGRKNVSILRYEDLANTESAWQKLASFLSPWYWSQSLFRQHYDIPSITTERSTSELHSPVETYVHLNADLRTRISTIVEHFGLKEFLPTVGYTTETDPVTLEPFLGL